MNVTDILGSLKAIIDPIGTPILLAFLGRLVWHTEQVQRGRRRFLSWHLLWELIAAVGVGLMADGAAVHAGLAGAPKTAAVVALAYLGPRGLEHVVLQLSRRGGGK
jgi:hypothetical protein